MKCMSRRGPESVGEVRDLLTEALEDASYPIRQIEIFERSPDLSEIVATLVSTRGRSSRTRCGRHGRGAVAACFIRQLVLRFDRVTPDKISKRLNRRALPVSPTKNKEDLAVDGRCEEASAISSNQE